MLLREMLKPTLPPVGYGRIVICALYYKFISLLAIIILKSYFSKLCKAPLYPHFPTSIPFCPSIIYYLSFPFVLALVPLPSYIFIFINIISILLIFLMLSLAIKHKTVVTFMRRSVSAVLRSKLCFSWLHSLS